MEQKYTSKDTCINVVNKVYRQKEFKDGSTILDYGGGRYDTNKEYMEARGHKLFVYDKFNRSREHNDAVLKEMEQNMPDYVVCSNVLNVIMEDEVIDEVLKDISRYSKATVILAVWEGNRSGIGMETKKGWQRNQKIRDYLPMIEKHFHVIKCSNGMAECMPKQENR